MNELKESILSQTEHDIAIEVKKDVVKDAFTKFSTKYFLTALRSYLRASTHKLEERRDVDELSEHTG